MNPILQRLKTAWTVGHMIDMFTHSLGYRTCALEEAHSQLVKICLSLTVKVACRSHASQYNAINGVEAPPNPIFYVLHILSPPYPWRLAYTTRGSVQLRVNKGCSGLLPTNPLPG